MKITKRQLRRIIKEEHAMAAAEVEVSEDSWAGGENLEHDLDHSEIATGESNVTSQEILELVAEIRKKMNHTSSASTLLEYEQYVDEDGNVYDDEGNVTKRGSAFGRRYGGGTYGTRGLPPARSKSGSTSRSYSSSSSRRAMLTALQAAVKNEDRPNKFLTSIISQLNVGRTLSSKQKGIVKKILVKLAPESVALFESGDTTALKNKLRNIVNEEVKSTKKYDDNSSLKGKQSDLPDPLQKGIIKKAGGDLDESDSPLATVTTSPGQLHRCMDGSMVPSDSTDCHDDIVSRIDDAEYNRNSHSCGTENRIYYNGLLKGLRKRRNKLKKSLASIDTSI